MSVSSLLGAKLAVLISLVGLGLILTSGWAFLRFARPNDWDRSKLLRFGVILLATGIIVRIAVALYVGADGVYYGDPYPELAQALASGQGYVGVENSPHFPVPGQPTAYFPPVWPFLLASLFRLFGQSVAFALALTTLMGIGLVFVVWGITRSILGEGMALVGANITMWHPAGILFPFSLGSDLLFALLSGLVLWLGLKALDGMQKDDLTPKVVWPLALGLAGGLAALTRGYGLVFYLVTLAIVVVMARRRWTQVLMSLTVCLVGCGIVLGPWIVRNASQLSSPVVVSTNGGVNLWIGNHAGSNLKYQGPPVPPGYSQDMLASITEPERDAIYRKAALEWIGDNPAQFVVNGVKKVVLVYATDFSPLSGVYSNNPQILNFWAFLILAALLNGFYWLLLILAFVGLGLLIHTKNLGFGALLASSPLLIGAVAFVFFAEGRFHWAAIPSLVPLAVVAIAWRVSSNRQLCLMQCKMQVSEKLLTS